MTPALRHATTLWHFLTRGRGTLAGSDVIVVCGSYDLRVCDHACALLQQGIAPRLLITGGTGNWTRHLWRESEAEVFAARARAQGVADDQLLLEPLAGNFAQNIAYAKALCPTARRATFVTKPNSIRRVQQTLPIQWPELQAAVDAPRLAFPEDVSNQIGVLGLIDEMVGDVHRLLDYPAQGFQTPLPIPDEVQHAWRALIALGFDRHLIPGSPPARDPSR
ncbi:MAG: YdcF family protein [Paludibacterium sp.]|uniref:YdcF family protein n=1 Tax=Paludibacterium sp. TaxID=1917523 RepID=UPI0025D1C8E9|nr:YdcF family protein [Paludibacterium sp.]MBV8045673.1 YdcF family protein [Paludibacterium sp.]MBV8649517.1 YdcF family protein [Paludibacterium sp.]